jgi:hypothetical protein
MRRGASAIETVLLLAVIGLALLWLTFKGLQLLALHHDMVTTLDALPVP